MASHFLLLGAVLLFLAEGWCAAMVTNSWAVQVLAGGEEAADALAIKYGFVNLGLVR